MTLWRKYPWPLQLILFILNIFILGWFLLGAVMPLLLYKTTGYTVAQILAVTDASPHSMTMAAIVYQTMFSISLFLLPCILFAFATHPRPSEYLGVRKPGNTKQPWLVALTMTGAIPLILALDYWMRGLHFGKTADQMQAMNDNMMNAYLHYNQTIDQVLLFVAIAVVAPIGEELFFRGVLMRFAHKMNGKMLFPILSTSLLFALIHYNPYGFVSIFLAGVLLAVIYYWTGSILMSMLAHFINNASQLLLTFWAHDNKELRKVLDQSTQLPWYVIAGGVVLFSIGIYNLWKVRTPLSKGWSNDFTSAEQHTLLSDLMGNAER